jgi:hypothetical protein
MEDALFIHRIHFAFSVTYHYIFPQLTMGLAPLLVVLKTLAFGRTTPSTTIRSDSGAAFLRLISSPAWSLASLSSSNSEPTGHNFRASLAA